MQSTPGHLHVAGGVLLPVRATGWLILKVHLGSSPEDGACIGVLNYKIMRTIALESYSVEVDY